MAEASESLRLELLRQYRILDTPPEEAFDELTRLASEICLTPVSLISFVDQDRLWLKSRFGLDMAELPRDISFCDPAILDRDVTMIEDLSSDPRFSGNPLVTAYPGFRFYAAVPLVAPEGVGIGTLCVLDTVPRQLTPAQARTLSTLGRSVMGLLELRRGARALEESETRLREVADHIDTVIWIRSLKPPRLLYLSPAFERIWGRPAQDFYQDSLALLRSVHPEDRKKVEAALDPTRLSGYDFEYRIVRPDGRIRWIHSRGSFVRSQDGRPERMVGVSEDVTDRKAIEDALTSQRGLLANLLSLARATTERPTLEATLQNTLAVAKSLTGADGASLLLLSDRPELTGSLMATEAKTVNLTPSEVVQILEEGLVGRVARTRQPALVADTSAKEWVPTRLTPGSPGSALAVPLSSGADLAGVLTLFHERPGQFRPDHVDLIAAAGAQIALALRNAQLFDTRSRLARRQTILYEVLRVASGDFDPGHIAQATADAISSRTGWLNVVVSIPGDDGCWSVHPTAPYLPEIRRQEINAGVVGRAYRTGETQLVKDVRLDPDYVAGSPAILSELAVPLRDKGRRLGVLNLEAPTLDAFDSDDVLLAESLAEVVALALANAGLYKEVAKERVRLEAVVQSSRDGILLLSAGHRILVANEQAVSLLRSAETQGSVAGLPFARMLTSLAPNEADTLLLAARPTGGQKAEGPQEGQVDLPWVALHFLSVPVPSLGRLLVLRDVTEERRVERMREDLTRTMVHDLRSPLSSAMGFLGLLEMDGLGPPGRPQMLQVAKRGMTRALALIDGILDVDRFEAGATPLEHEPLDLTAVVNDVAELMRPLFVTAEVPLETTCPPTLPPVSGDAQILTRVLQNLLENALKFSPRGAPVRLSVGTSGVESVEVSVSDSGPGIAPDLRSRLFQKFARGREPHQGSGLGLAFCRLAIEAHGGRVWAAERPGPGATFTFTLPTVPGGAC